MRPAQPGHLEYADASVSYRAPRVGVVTRTDGDWIYWAREAIYACCSIWGGSGFVLVPHRRGVVDPIILRAVKAYDPDYVVTMPTTMGQHDTVYPGAIEAEIESQRAAGADADALEALRNQLPAFQLNAEDDQRARKAVVAACSPYRMALGGDADPNEWTERILILQADDSRNGPLTPIHLVEPKQPPVFGAKASLNSPFGLMVANQFGIVGTPTTELGQVLERDEELFVRSLAGPRSSSLIRPHWSCFERIDDEGAGEEPQSAWSATQTELTHVNDYRYNAILHVVGNEPEDFSLAMIWERLYGQAVWICDELWVPGASPLADKHASSLAHGMARNIRSPSGMARCVVSSVTSDRARLDEFVDSIVAVEPLVVMRDISTGAAMGDELGKDQIDVLPGEVLDFPDRGRYFLGLRRHYQRSTTVPVIRDSEDGATLAASADAPVLDAPKINLAALPFHVDLDIHSVVMPQGRAVPPAALIHKSDNYLDRYRAWVRNGRTGVSYESLRFDFVQAGILPEERFARPRIKKPGMMAWARARAEMCGYDAQVSDAGWPAHVLAGMFGSRCALAEAFSGPLRSALLQYMPKPAGTATSDVFDNKEGQRGAVINRSVYLTLLGFQSISGRPEEDVRQLVDESLVSGLLTRGLLLGCSICHMFSFHAVDAVGRSIECPRCGNIDDFTHARYRVPAGEPDWFYDLHPLGRNLVRDNGDIPLLLATYLRMRAENRYADTTEIVIRRGRRTVAEADLVAVADGRLIVAEAKCNGSFGDGDEAMACAQGRVKLAEIFDADEIVMATTAPSWKSNSLDAMAQAVAQHDWPNGLAPKIRAITSLAGEGKGTEINL